MEAWAAGVRDRRRHLDRAGHPGEPDRVHQAGRQPRRHRLSPGPPAGSGGLRHPQPYRRGIRPPHLRGEHLCGGPAAQPAGGHDRAGRPQLRRRRPGRPDRPCPGGVPDPRPHRPGHPPSSPSCAATTTALTCHALAACQYGYFPPRRRWQPPHLASPRSGAGSGPAVRACAPGSSSPPCPWSPGGP